MAKIYNLEEFKNKLNKGMEKEHEIDMAILLSAIKYIYLHMPNPPEQIFESITLNASTEILFGKDRNRFAAMFEEIVQYWHLAPLPEEEIPMDVEFERFPTVEDICCFIEKKVNKIK